MGLVLALDQGTTSSRAILFDEEGEVRAQAAAEFDQQFPRPGWVEHDPEAIWKTQQDVAVRVLDEAGIRAREVDAIGVTNQRETVVVWDAETGEPIHNAIVWQDRRTARACARLREDGHEDRVRETTGLVLDPYFSATKVAWILDHVSGARARAEGGRLRMGTVDAWLLHKLTGGRVHATDPSNASRTLLFDIRSGAWDDEMLALFDVPRGLLPAVVPSSGVLGEVSDPEALAGIPIAGVAGDQQAALFGQACFEPGGAKCTYGTGCFLLLNTGTEPVVDGSRLLASVAWDVAGRRTYALEGSVFIGGAVVQWLRDGLGLIASSGDVEALARSVPDTGGVYFVPALAGLGAPHWDAFARGAIVGITRGTTKAHVARAALEAIAHQVTDVIEAMDEGRDAQTAELRVDGGAAVNDTLLQEQADQLGVPVLRPAITESTARGAAWLAGLAAGTWKDASALATGWRLERRFEPQRDRADSQARRERWRDALSRARAWAVDE